MNKRLLFLASVAVASLCVGSARATLIESWDNTLDGWQVPSPFGSNTSFVPGFDPAIGVTDGTASLTVSSPSAGPNYSQLLISPASTTLTAMMASASAVNLDVFAPAGSFGGFLQFDIDINNTDSGFVSLDSFSYPSTILGAEHTITVPVSAALNATLAASSNTTTMIIQVGGGFTAGNGTMYLDNLRTTDIAPTPEPASLGLLSLGSLLLVRRRR